jgi:hypothetical protein
MTAEKIRAAMNQVTSRDYPSELGVRCAEQHRSPARRTAIVRGMPSEPFVDEGFPERWAAWQARGAAHARATRRKVFVAAILVLSVAILGSVWTF